MLGAIPRERGIEEDALLSHIKANTLTYQAYSELRTNLIFSHEKNLNVQGRKANSIVVTPVMPMPRGPYVSINLAASIASTGRRVLLVDCCLREPDASASWERRANRGWRRYWKRQGRLERGPAHPLSEPHPASRRSGAGRPHRPALASRLFRTAAGLEWKYDQMVLDVPVLGTSVDAALIASVVASCLVVIDFRSCTRTPGHPGPGQPAPAEHPADRGHPGQRQAEGARAPVALHAHHLGRRHDPGHGLRGRGKRAEPAGLQTGGRAISIPARTIVEEEYPEGESDNLLAEAVRLGRAGSPLPVNWLTSLISENPEERDKVVAAFYAYYEAALKRYDIEPQPARKMADEILPHDATRG